MFLLGMFLLMGSASAQPGGNSIDKAYWIDKKSGKVISMEGTLKESASGIVISQAGKEKARFNSAEVVKVEIGDQSGFNSEDKGMLFSLENDKDFEKAARGYNLLAKKAQNNERLRRSMEFRELMTLVKAMDAKDEAEFKVNAPSVVSRLTAFARANSKSWEAWPTTMQAARLLTELEKHDQAATLLSSLSGMPDLGNELKSEARLAEVDCLLRSSNPAAGRAAVSTLLLDKTFPESGSARERLAIYDLWSNAPPRATTPTRPEETLTKLQAALDAAKSPLARALGFQARGEVLLTSGFPRDALWEFLNVEVVYNQDKDEVRKAQRRIVEVFEAIGDKDRADQYREKLKRGK
ncbi:MAG: hypothetical protein U0798_04650 [Gemmataceae bacterium]